MDKNTKQKIGTLLDDIDELKQDPNVRQHCLQFPLSYIERDLYNIIKEIDMQFNQLTSELKEANKELLILKIPLTFK